MSMKTWYSGLNGLYLFLPFPVFHYRVVCYYIIFGSFLQCVAKQHKSA
jgi:hypothetical protein